jgi:hypothetical protein
MAVGRSAESLKSHLSLHLSLSDSAYRLSVQIAKPYSQKKTLVLLCAESHWAAGHWVVFESAASTPTTSAFIIRTTGLVEHGSEDRPRPEFSLPPSHLARVDEPDSDNEATSAAAMASSSLALALSPHGAHQARCGRTCLSSLLVLLSAVHSPDVHPPAQCGSRA